MTRTPLLQPTLWRTCRALANQRRLRIFGLLVREPGQTVSAVAQRLKRPLPVASQYLRILEARGLLTARRVGRWVEYQASNSTTAREPIRGLVAALRLTFQREPRPVVTIFKLATAFTHPRRIEIFRTLQNEAQTLNQLRAATGISIPALRRHLCKLENRGFVVCRLGGYCVVNRVDVLGRELARLAAELHVKG